MTPNSHTRTQLRTILMRIRVSYTLSSSLSLLRHNITEHRRTHSLELSEWHTQYTFQVLRYFQIARAHTQMNTTIRHGYGRKMMRAFVPSFVGCCTRTHSTARFFRTHSFAHAHTDISVCGERKFFAFSLSRKSMYFSFDILFQRQFFENYSCFVH